MRDIMEEKPARDFTTIDQAVARFISCIVLVSFISLFSCDSSLSDDPIPYTPFPDLVINLTQSSYNNLNSLGWVYLAPSEAGTRGVILYKLNATTYLAFERNCSYQPNDACATVDVHSSNLYMLDACCNSTFRFSDGAPTGGPAWRNLRQYSTSLNGSTLTITDEIVP